MVILKIMFKKGFVKQTWVGKTFWMNIIAQKDKPINLLIEDYLMKLSQSKYGLCLRGYGSKCHREVELMAFGTVPIITPEVSIKSNMNPPIENVHYITANNPNVLKEREVS